MIKHGVSGVTGTPFLWSYVRIVVKKIRRWRVISKEHMINDEIRAKEVRLVGAEGEQIGIKPIREALQMAIDLNLDLVNVAPQAKPPVCRIMDYGKFRYETQKKEKEARKTRRSLISRKSGSVLTLRNMIIKLSSAM